MEDQEEKEDIPSFSPPFFFKKKDLIALAVIAVLTVAIPTSIYLVQQKQNNSPKAATALGYPLPVSVLALKYFPTTACYNPINKLDTVGAVASSPDPIYEPPYKAIDGNIFGTKWQPISTAGGVSLQIDFGSVKSFKALVPYFYYFDRPQSYHFDVSTDGVNWTRLITETDSLQGFMQVDSASVMQRRIYTFNLTSARYVKFVVDQYLNSDPNASGQINFYELEFYGELENKQCLDFNEVGDVGIRSDASMADPLSSARERTDTVDNDLMGLLVKGSIYHGYRDAGVTPSLTYNIYENKEFYTPVPVKNGYADHQQILTNLNICDYVVNKGVKEVWLWMYHTSRVSPVESYQTGPNHQAGNGWMELPVCAKSYTVYDFNLGRGLGEALEDHSHHIESLWKSLDAEANQLYQNFTGQEDEFKPNNLSLPLHCGWSHCPPNVIISPNNCNLATNTCYCEGYNWTSERTVNADCENWKPDGTGAQTSVNCHTWYGSGSCLDNGGLEFKVWWMQNMPGKNNGLAYNGRQLKNWWDFIGDFDRAIQDGKGITYLVSTSTPTPVITFAPTPTPTSSPIDTVAPTVTITFPLNGSTVVRNSRVTITASVTDNLGGTGIGKVEFLVKGSLKCTDTASPYSCSWKVGGKPQTSYLLQVRAYDRAGNIATQSISVSSK